MHLATAAMAIAAAHRYRVYHGAVCTNNVIVDHLGSARLIDAGSNRGVVTDQSASGRIAHDVSCLTRMIQSACDRWKEPWSRQLAKTINRLSKVESDETCYLIGDRLSRQADSLSVDS